MKPLRLAHALSSSLILVATFVTAHAQGPTVTSVTPNIAPLCGADVILAVTGSNFVAGSYVQFNGIGVPQATTLVDATDLTVYLLKNAECATGGTLSITVVNPDGEVSPPVNFVIQGPGGTTYKYIGSTFVYFWGGFACPPECLITGSFTVAEPLAANLNRYRVVPGSWSFSDGFSTVNGTNTLFTDLPSGGAPPYDNGIYVSTDSTGTITSWSVGLGVQPPGDFMLSSPAFDVTGTGCASCAGAAGATSNNGTVSSPPGTWTSSPAPPLPLQITTTSLPGVSSGQPYSATLTATGGSGTGYTWCVQSGLQCLQSGSPLPDGFTLSAAGIFSSTGSPAAAVKSYPFTVQVTDSAGNIATRAFTLEISCAVDVYLQSFNQYMEATFNAPDLTSQLLDYAQSCGFVSFDWQQMITVLPAALAGKNRATPNLPSNLPNNVYPVSPTKCSSTAPADWPSNNCSLVAGPSSLTGNASNYPAFFDPPKGGYTYLLFDGAPENPYPYVYPPYPSQYFGNGAVCTVAPTTNMPGQDCPPFPDIVDLNGIYLSFVDAPADPSLPGDAPSPDPKPGRYIAFSTSLVGVDSQNQPHTLKTWTWNSTFSGTAGGVSQTALAYPVDPGSGTGGVTITSINGVPVPTVTVTPSSSSVTTAQILSVTVAVSGGSGKSIPTGSIILTSGSYASMAATLSSGNATIDVPAGSLATGTDTLTASYTPDAASSSTYAKASGFASVMVQDFTLAVASGSSSSQSASPGQTATYTLSVGSEGGFDQSVSFSCTGAPPEASCAVSPSSKAPSGNITVTVATSAPSVGALRTLPPLAPRLPDPQSLLMLATLLAGLAWTVRGRKRVGAGRGLTELLPLAGLLLALALAGCGDGSGGGSSGNLGTPAGTYNLTITGTVGSGSTALSHSVTLTLKVS